MRRHIAFLAVALALGAPGGAALAGSSGANPPPVVLSPNLTGPWINQLQPGYRQRAKKPRRSIFSNWRRSRRNGGTYQATGTGRLLPDPRSQRATGSHRGQAATARAPAPTIAPQFLPTVVDYSGGHPPGTVIVDTSSRYLFLVEPNGRARRYGVGVGRQGFAWSGTERISRKAEWPAWRPPAEMIARERAKGRNLPAYVPGGPKNPLGARALYLGSTLYRIHGSNEPWSIGRAVSSGCIRMRNEDVTDLYQRVGVGTKVVVL